MKGDRPRMRNRTAFRNEEGREECGKKGREEINTGVTWFLFDNIQLDYRFVSVFNPFRTSLMCEIC